MQIRPVCPADIAAITAVYNEYILKTPVTFEMTALTPEEMQRRVAEKIRTGDWLVAAAQQRLLGYAYYGAFHSRPAYRYTVESSIYLAPDQVGQGIGTRLYTRLLEAARDRGCREVVALITLPNAASVRLHQKLGFTQVGILRNVGCKFDQFLDVALWQKSLRLPPGGVAAGSDLPPFSPPSPSAPYR